MKKTALLLSFFLVLGSSLVNGQEIKTVFKGAKSSGGYGALTNKFSYIDGQYANIVGVYGGWYVNHKFLLGIGANAMTNYMAVPIDASVNPLLDLSYGYVDFGLA